MGLVKSGSGTLIKRWWWPESQAIWPAGAILKFLIPNSKSITPVDEIIFSLGEIKKTYGFPSLHSRALRSLEFMLGANNINDVRRILKFFNI